eukprot:10522596-Alexandrium_andersonii.AAC.1
MCIRDRSLPPRPCAAPWGSSRSRAREMRCRSVARGMRWRRPLAARLPSTSARPCCPPGAGP